jgi:protoheme IX farnesyltransferase
MQITQVAVEKTEIPSKRRSRRIIFLNYLQVLKPLPTALLGFIGVCTAFIAAGGQFSWKLLLVLGTVIVASAGANGLTNYLDRDIDKRMQRTCYRVLPSGVISPPKKVLPNIIGLIIIGLLLAWLLHPYVFIADALGTLVAATWRKKVTCVYPQGILASCAPIVMGWLAVSRSLNWVLLLLCLLIAAWLPLHVWSVNITHRDDYQRAGLNYFPINLEVKDSVKVLLAFAVFLYAVSLALYIVGGFNWLYLIVVNILGIVTIRSSVKLVVSRAAEDSWRLYRLSAFPYLGVIFLAMCLDIRFLG